MKKFGTAVLAASAVCLLAAAPAVAAPRVNMNTAEYWSARLGMECTMTSVSGVMSWTADMNYGAVIVKGGSVDLGGGLGPGNALYQPAYKDQSYSAPINAGGQQAAISHLITCDPGGGGGGYEGNS